MRAVSLASEKAVPPAESAQISIAVDNERRVRIPVFPLYSELRLILPIWQGCSKSRITGLQSTIADLRGNPQNPLDWSNPEMWIAERLQGSDRELAETIWRNTNGKVNPRYLHGHWYLARGFQLLQEDKNGQMQLTEQGQDFIADAQGKTVALIDEAEGLLKLLTLVAEKGMGQRKEFLLDWTAYLRRHSGFGTDSTIKDTLRRRLQNLLDRGLISRAGISYSITDEGLAYLKQTNSNHPEATSEHQQIIELIKQQKNSVRSRLQSLLDEINPFAFEHLIKQLLEVMGYQNVEVTSQTNDKGIDIIADIEVGITSVREVVQVKRHQNNIQRPVLDALRGSLHRFDAMRGTIITVGDFSKGTVGAAIERGAAPITLINGEKLIDLLIKHELGIRIKPIQILELDPDVFMQISSD